MREIVESLTRCTIIGVYIVVAIAVASGVISFFGVSQRKSRAIVLSLAGLLFVGVSLKQLIKSPEPVLGVSLFAAFVASLGAGVACARLTPCRNLDGTLKPPVQWSVFVLFVFVLAALVGNGYPANPLAVTDLVHRMRHPLNAILIGLVAALTSLVASLHPQRGDAHTGDAHSENKPRASS